MEPTHLAHSIHHDWPLARETMSLDINPQKVTWPIGPHRIAMVKLEVHIHHYG